MRGAAETARDREPRLQLRAGGADARAKEIRRRLTHGNAEAVVDLVPIKIDNGEEKAGAYLLRSYGCDFHVNPCEMLISCPTDRGALFLGKLKDLFFDSTCEFQLVLSDVIWAVAMMTCVVMIDD